MENIIKQLTQIYLNEETWHKKKLSYEDSIEYHRKMIEKGNIFYVLGNYGIVLGYCESLRVNFEQWGRLVCHAPFYSYDENTTDGNICVVHNVWIEKDFRNSYVVKELRTKFFQLNKHCEYFVGSALRKKTQPIKVFNRAKLEKLVERMSFPILEEVV